MTLNKNFTYIIPETEIFTFLEIKSINLNADHIDNLIDKKNIIEFMARWRLINNKIL